MDSRGEAGVNEKRRNNFTTVMSIIIGILLILILITSALLIVRPLISDRYQERLVEKNLALGNRYLSEMEYEKAVTSFSKVVRIDNKNTEAHIGLGDAYSGLGRWVEAADSYDNAVQTVVERVFVDHPERKENAETVIRDEVMKKAGLDDSGHEYMKGEELAAIDVIVDYVGGPGTAEKVTEPAGRYENPTPELILDMVVKRNDATKKAVDEIRGNDGDLSPYQDFIDWYEQSTPNENAAAEDNEAATNTEAAEEADAASSGETAESNEELELLRPFLGSGWSSASMDVDQDGNPTPYISAVIYETYIEKHYSSGEVYRDEISSVEKDAEGIMIKMADGQAYFAPEDSLDTLWRYFDWERRADNMSGSDSLYRSVQNTDPDWEDQLDVIKENYVLWDVSENDYSYVTCNYAVTDLDHNNRLEIISTASGGTGNYTFFKVHEVNRSKDGLELVFDNFQNDRGQLPDFGFTTEAVTYKNGDRYVYILWDGLRNGWEYYYYSKMSLEKAEKTIALKMTSYYSCHRDINGNETYSYFDYNDNEISEDQYHASEDLLFRDMEKGVTSIAWFEAVENKSDLLKRLGESWKGFKYTPE